MQYLLTAVLTPFEDGSGYEARVPAIPHCVTSGRDMKEALEMVNDAASLMLVEMENSHAPLPEAETSQQLPAPQGGAVSLLILDTDRYRMMNDTRAVRKNVSIPAWMANLAEKRGVNCSQVLQDALRRLFGV